MRLTTALALAFLALITFAPQPSRAADVPAPAATKTPAKPVCGKTVDECQKAFDGLQGQLDAAQGNIQSQVRELNVYKLLLGEANDRLAAQAH